MTGMPAVGDVIGVDVGYSPTRRSSAVCRLSWDERSLDWEIRRFRHLEDDRLAAMIQVAGKRDILVAAFDGPFRHSLDLIDRYRTAEAVLTSKELRERIGKPGQSNSGNGRRLNAATNDCVRTFVECVRIGKAMHQPAVHPLAIVEAFPTSFLGLLIEQPAEVRVRPPARSDAYFVHLANTGGFDRLLAGLLPGRAPRRLWSDVTNHDDRAALACALTALAVAAGDFLAVGDLDGYIILPSAKFIQPWALPMLPPLTD